MAKKDKESLEQIKARVLKVATKKALSGAELAEKYNVRFNTNYSGRGIGRAVGQLVSEGKLRKVGAASRPSYEKI